MNDETEKVMELMEDLMELKRQSAAEKRRLGEDSASIKGVLKRCKNPEEFRKEEERIARLKEEREKALNELMTAKINNVKEIRDYLRELIKVREVELKQLRATEMGMEEIESQLKRMEWD